jgi:hypothetical protein
MKESIEKEIEIILTNTPLNDNCKSILIKALDLFKGLSQRQVRDITYCIREIIERRPTVG